MSLGSITPEFYAQRRAPRETKARSEQVAMRHSKTPLSVYREQMQEESRRTAAAAKRAEVLAHPKPWHRRRLEYLLRASRREQAVAEGLLDFEVMPTRYYP